MGLAVYLFSAFLVLIAAHVVFRLFVRRDYQRNGRLSPISGVLQWFLFFLWAFLGVYSMPNPAWPSPQVREVLQIIGLILAVIGVGGTVATMIWFGMRRTSGLEVRGLLQFGPYRLTRNPQLVTFGLAVIGFGVAFLSWQALGWVALYVIIAHMMVLTEEEHLTKVFGEEYERYCRRVPRYLGLRGRK